MVPFHTDTPITGEAGSEDQLNRTGFAERIARALVLAPGSPALVASLEGKWGYGKTSVINLIAKCLDALPSNEKPIVFKFNPWIVGGAERLVQEFLTQLAAVIGTSNPAQNFRAAAKKMLAYSKVFSVLKLVPGAEIAAALLENVSAAVGNATEAFADLQSANIETQRVAVTDALGDLCQPIVVFIDDMDRLPPAEVFQMVRLIKAVADFPRTAFVLAFDPAYVEEALKQHGIAEARAYLDKLVQIRLHLPQIGAQDIHQVTMKELGHLQELSTLDLTGHFDRDREALGELYHRYCKPLIRSIRDVKRVFNRLRFTEPVTRGEVRFSEVFALEVIAIKAPAVYDLLKAHPAAFTGSTDQFGHFLGEPKEYVGIYKDRRDMAIASASPDDQACVRALVERLFPLTSDTFSGRVVQDEFRSQGRVAATDRLMIALSFGLPSDEVSSSDVYSFIHSPETRVEIIENQIANNKLVRFIELLRDRMQIYRPIDLRNFLLKLAMIADDNRVSSLDKDNSDLLAVRVTVRLWWIVEACIEQLPSDERSRLLYDLFSREGGFAVPTIGLRDCLREHGFLHDEGSLQETKRLCDQQTLEQIKTLWLNTVKDKFNDRSFLDANANDLAIWLLADLDAKFAAELVAPLMERDDDLDRIVKIFGISGQDTLKGRFSRVTPDFLDRIGGVDVWKNRVKRRLEGEKVTDNVLLAVYRSIITGKPHYLIDGSESDPF